MQQHTFTTTLKMRSGSRSRLILPASITEVRTALEARVARAPDDIAARVSLGELNLSVSLAASARADLYERHAAHGLVQPAPDLLRVRHFVPNLARTRCV
jgi:hypothetical protein